MDVCRRRDVISPDGRRLVGALKVKISLNQTW